jgi:paraquat-inducible protein B
MARRANPTLIGAFVLGGIALAVTAVLLLGGREWFKRPVTCVMAFDGNVAGLNVGSPVSFRGVQLGTVARIELRVGTPLIVVLAEIEPSRIRGMPSRPTQERVEGSIRDAINVGLRAQLQVLSLLTGQLYVGLDYHPDTPARLTRIDPDRCEIPTIPTTLAQVQDQMRKIMAELEQLPLKQIVESAARTIEGVDRIVHAPEMTRAVKSLDATLLETQALVRSLNARVDPTAKALHATLEQTQRTIDDVGRDVRKLVATLDSQVKPLVTNLEATSDSARTLMRDAQETLRSIDAQLAPVLTSLRTAGDAARDALRKAEGSLSQVDGVFDGNSPLGYQLVDALNELTRAARALRFLTEEIDRQPNVLLFGRGGSAGGGARE